jgi:hypothetical protein
VRGEREAKPVSEDRLVPQSRRKSMAVAFWFPFSLSTPPIANGVGEGEDNGRMPLWREHPDSSCSPHHGSACAFCQSSPRENFVS